MDPKTACNHYSCISLVPIFNHLEPAQMDEIMESTRSLSFKRGEMVYRAGETSNTLYIVRTGRVRIYRISESGKEQVLRVLTSGDFTGELALFNETIHESYAVAQESTDVCTMTRASLQSFLVKYPSIALKILAEFSSRLEQSEKQTTRLTSERVETRIALYLLEQLTESKDSQTITLPMSKKDLSSYLGTTPETLSRRLAELEDEGYIQQITNKKIKVLNKEGLTAI